MRKKLRHLNVYFQYCGDSNDIMQKLEEFKQNNELQNYFFSCLNIYVPINTNDSNNGIHNQSIIKGVDFNVNDKAINEENGVLVVAIHHYNSVKVNHMEMEDKLKELLGINDLCFIGKNRKTHI